MTALLTAEQERRRIPALARLVAALSWSWEAAMAAERG
jgi:hypothetical protein